MKRLVYFGGVDCSFSQQHNQLCGEYGVKGVPTIRTFAARDSLHLEASDHGNVQGTGVGVPQAGRVRRGTADETLRRDGEALGIKKFPTLMVVPKGSSEPVIHTGGLSHISLSFFLDKFAKGRDEL